MNSRENSTITNNNAIISGSILSPDSRNNIVKSSAIVSSVGLDNLAVIQNKQKQLDDANSIAVAEQQQVFDSFNSGIQNLRSDIGKLNTNLSGIALLLQQDAATDQNRILSEQDKERKLAEQQIRIGKESEIEQKIQNAVTEPAEKLIPRVNNLFGGIGSALTLLFTGWLTNQVVSNISSSSERASTLFGNIKFSALKNIGIVAGGLFALKAGFSLVKKKIGDITLGLLKFFIPLPKLPGIGGGGFGIGKFVTLLSSFKNEQNKEYVDATLGAISLASALPGPLGAIAKIAGIAFTADEIAEAFGKNIFGDDRDKKVDEIAQRFMGQPESPPSAPPTKASPEAPGKPSEAAAPAAASSPPAPAPVVAVPQQTLMGQPAAPALTPEKISQFEKAWKYKDNPLARGRIEAAWGKMTPDEQKQAQEWAKTKGYDWTEMKLLEPRLATPAVVTPTASDTTTSSTEPTKIVPVNLPAEVSSIPKEPQQVGQLPEPNPKITVIAPFTRNNAQSELPLTNGALSDVPLISSSNPDNFYILYSQLNYNVVI